MKVRRISDFNTDKNPHNVRMSVLFKSDKNNIAYVKLKPGDIIKPHAAPAKVIFIVLEGSGIVILSFYHFIKPKNNH